MGFESIPGAREMTPEEIRTDIEKYQREKGDLLTKVHKLQDDIAQVENRKENINPDPKEKEKTISALQENIEIFNKQQEELQRKIEDLQK